ncbi:MAG: 5'/3'-nucleotidase SurE [Candidatus Acidiferrales bacterium]
MVTNDDGYDAAGLRVLAEALTPLGQVVVAAPLQDESGSGHGTTTREFISVRQVEIGQGVRGYAIAARPATCVRMALETLLPRKPDVVVSGINRGVNLGIVVNYSGTVGAAREAAFLGIPAIAVSLESSGKEDFTGAGQFVRRLLEQLHRQGQLRPGLFLNVNVPARESSEVRITRQSTAPTPQLFTRYTNPRGELYVFSDYRHLHEDQEGTDVWALVRGFITITPLSIDQTRAVDLERLRQLDLRPVPLATH